MDQRTTGHMFQRSQFLLFVGLHEHKTLLESICCAIWEPFEFEHPCAFEHIKIFSARYCFPGTLKDKCCNFCLHCFDVFFCVLTIECLMKDRRIWVVLSSLGCIDLWISNVMKATVTTGKQFSCVCQLLLICILILSGINNVTVNFVAVFSLSILPFVGAF